MATPSQLISLLERLQIDGTLHATLSGGTQYVCTKMPTLQMSKHRQGMPAWMKVLESIIAIEIKKAGHYNLVN